MLPATSAATVMPVGIASGKFQGGMTTATPRGSVLGDVGLAGDVAAPGLGQADHLAGVELAEVDRLGDVAVGLAPRACRTRRPPTRPARTGARG